jgi:hypothetical protein
VDTINGVGLAPAFVLLLVQRLPDDSYTHALARGGREHFGWGTDRHMFADLYDALNANTRATGNWGKGKAPKIQPWPRPGKDSKGKAKRPGVPTTVRDLYHRISGGS